LPIEGNLGKIEEGTQVTTQKRSLRKEFIGPEEGKETGRDPQFTIR